MRDCKKCKLNNPVDCVRPFLKDNNMENKKLDLQELITRYKKTNNQKILNEIVCLLSPTIKAKARFIYNKKWFRIDKKRNIKASELKNISEEDKPKYINLRQSGKTTLEDVEQDLWLELLEIIKRYDGRKSFSKYLSASIWNWRPALLNAELIHSTKEYSLADYDKAESEKVIDKRVILTLKDKEQEIVKLLQNKTRPIDIARLLGYSRSYISKVIKKIAKKLRN